ncbi:MAG: hypothetical protein F9K40_16275 [Kofleriaceae bacterium]|nr:MAG: hypothetical protein F9K40_16275 [Kofleriaceae bacterium]
MRRFVSFALGVSAIIGTGRAPAVAGPYSEVASAFDPGDGFDLHLSLDYRLDIRRSAILREDVGRPGTGPVDGIPVVRDLVFAGSRHTIIPRLELGLFKDVSFSAAMPYVLSQQGTFELDQRDTPCDFDGADATCVNRMTSSTFADGILPGTGFDGQNGGAGFDADDPTVFRSPTRRGLDQIHLGLTWAPMTQLRDDTKPTWKLGIEGRLPVGKVATIDANDLDGSSGVGRGVTEVRLWTSMARRLGWAEPYVEAWWLAPVSVKSDSLFGDPGFGARSTGPQQQGGLRFGFEGYAVDQGDEGARLAIELSARIVGHFEGRNYSEMWEVFALAGDASGTGPLILDADPTQDMVQALDHPGITNIENYMEMGGRVAARIAVGQKFRLSAAFELTAENEHVITFTDAGVDLPECSGSGTSGCELLDDELVTPGTPEVNPLHVPLTDLVGHRYRTGSALNYVVGVNATLLF